MKKLVAAVVVCGLLLGVAISGYPMWYVADHADGAAIAGHGEGGAIADHGDGPAVADHGEGGGIADHGEGGGPIG